MAGFRFLATGVDGLRAVTAESGHVFPRHSHEEFGIGVILDGAQISASGRGQVTAEPGDVITVNPGEVHDGAPMGHGGRSWAMFYIDPKLMADYHAGLQGVAAGFEFEAPVMRHALLARALKGLHVAMRTAGGSSPLAIDEGLLTLLSGVMRPADGSTAPSITRALRRAVAMIDDNPSASPSLQQLANEARLTRFQTLRAFVKATGFTPHAYLMQRRFDLARRLISTPSGLADIAARSGYADQSHMTREFRRRYGVTPSSYRRAVSPCNSVQDSPRRS